MGTSVLLLALVATTSGHTPAGLWRSASTGGEPRPLDLPHHHSHEVNDASTATGDLRSDDDLLRPEDLITGDLVNLRDFIGPGDLTSLTGPVNDGELLNPGDVISSGDTVSPTDLVSTGDLMNTGDVVSPGNLTNPGDPVSQGHLVRTGDLVRESDVVGTSDEMSPGRTKRKVISRGGHYIVWSRSGTSPWSSTSYETIGDYRINNNREYGWSSRGRIGDGGTRKFYVQPESDKKDRRASRKKLNKSFKREIAQYAMVYGTHKAAVHYEETIGRRLRDRVVQKFVQRYQERRKRKRRRRRRRGHS